jgi:hypothetical protein
MSLIVDSIFTEWRASLPEGSLHPNTKNGYHLFLLKEICLKRGISENIINSVLLALEAKDDGGLDADEIEKAKSQGLVSQGFGRWGKDKDGPMTHKTLNGKLVPANKDDLEKQKSDREKEKVGGQAGGETGGTDVKQGNNPMFNDPKTGEADDNLKNTGGLVDPEIKKVKKPKTVDGKNKELNQSINTFEQETFSRTETEPDDDSFTQSNSEHSAQSQLNFEREMERRFRPQRFPKKYLKTLGRMLNTSVEGMVTRQGKIRPPVGQLGHYTNEGGAGEIRSQAGELIGMIGSSIQDPKKREQFFQMLEEHMDNNGNNLVADKSWVQAARLNNQAIDDSLNTEYPDGYEVIASAWDVDSEAEALGMEPPIGKNKGGSTDQYMKVKTPDGKTHLVEISLKKTKSIRLTNTTPEALVDMKNFTEDEKKELENNLKDVGIEDVPKPGDGKTDIEDVKNTAYSEYQQKKYLEFGNQNRNEIVRLIKDGKISQATLNKLGIDSNNPEERLDYILNGKGLARVRNKLFLQAAEQIPNGQAVIDDVNNNTKKVLSNITKAIGVDPIKSKMLESVKEKLPLRSLVSGEESMAVGDFIMDKRTMAKVFGTDDFDKIKDDLQVDLDEVPPVIKYIGKGVGKPIIVATINIREDGIGYGNSLRFDMSLSNDFATKCKEAHKSELKQAPRA